MRQSDANGTRNRSNPPTRSNNHSSAAPAADGGGNPPRDYQSHDSVTTNNGNATQSDPQTAQSDHGRSDSSANQTPNVEANPETSLSSDERELLESSAPKAGDQISQQELQAEFDVAARSQSKPSTEPGYVRQIELPNGHILRQRPDGSWCRFSTNPTCNLSALNPALRESPYHPDAVEQRSQTNREHYEALNEKALTEERLHELAEQGHGPARHGPQLTQGQLHDRAVKGFDPVTGSTDDAYLKFPDGTPKPHRYGRHATHITSQEAYVQGENFIRNSQKFQDEMKAAIDAGEDRFAIKGVALEDIYGSNYKQQVYGQTRQGSKNNPTGSIDTDFTDGTMRAVYHLAEDGNWNLLTMFPEPK